MSAKSAITKIYSNTLDASTLEIRTAAEQQVGELISDAEWAKLEAFGAIEHVRLGHHDLNWLTERVWDLKQHQRRPRAPSIAPASAADYQSAASQLVALEAGRDRDVVAFRSKYLAAGLLKPETVADWIHEQGVAQGHGTHYLEVPLPSDVRVHLSGSFGLVTTPPLTINDEHAGSRVRVKTVSYLKHGSEWVHHAVTAHGSVLERLRRLSDHVADATGWWKAQATDFVLTGRTPYLPEVGVAVEPKGRGRFVLRVDPMVTPRELSRRYQVLRRQVFNDRRLRTLTAKHLALAVFIAERPDSNDWELLRQQWNSLRPRADHYAAANRTRFKRDAQDATKRLDEMKISIEQALKWGTTATATKQQVSKKGVKRHAPRKK